MLRHAPIAIAISLFVVGCGGGSSSKPDAGGTGGGSLGGTGLNADGGGLTGGGGSTSVTVPPTGTTILKGPQLALLDLGAPCTNEVGATGDRWCAFMDLSGATNAALFVVNVTKAVGGTPVTCAATDPNCLNLTGTFGEDDNHPALFNGDTLVYYDGLTGVPYGWRPGMTAGKALATIDSDADAFCTPAAKGTAIYCGRVLPTAMQTDPMNTVLVDILAGHLESAPLAKVDTVIGASSADMSVGHFQVGFPISGGETIAWSARGTTTGPEVLKMQTMGNDASRATVASGVNAWSVSPDGARWYWLTGVSETTGVGALQSAPYPAGTGPAAVASNVLMFDFPTPTSLALVDMAKNLTYFADPAGAPAGSTSLDTGVASFLSFDGKGTIAYVKTIVRNTDGSVKGSDLFVKKTDGTACTLTSATDAFPLDFSYTGSSKGAAWVQQTIVAAAPKYTRFSDCMKMTVPADSKFVFTRSLGDRGIIYLDGYDSTAGVATMKVKALAADGALSADPETVVSGAVGSLMVTPSGGDDLIVYTVNGGSNDDGVYVWKPGT